MANPGPRALGGLLTEARELLNDVVPISGSTRFTDTDLIRIVNEALLQIRSKRPDAWLSYGLRKPLVIYTMPEDNETAIPIDDQFYSPLLYYVVGRAELVEDTFADNGRAITMIGKFNSLLLKNTG
jgi:hypothetical protein